MKLLFSLAYSIIGCKAWSNQLSHRTTGSSRPKFSSKQHVLHKLYMNSNPNSSEYNIVFRPSTDPDAFDSSKIGVSRVHRYASTTKRSDGEVDAEYVMWYHGRNSNLDPSNTLPPLSTGRIGRAISKNGLHWERCLEASLSEDTTGVSLGLNKESWWGFDTTHIGLGQVLLPMSTPAVMTQGGVYLMYYMGGNYEETSIAQYLETDAPGAEELKLQGMNMRIGVALSQDGISFGRVEGDDPTGAIMAPYDESDPNMKWMKTMRDDDESVLRLEEELYCAWPEVVVNINDDQTKKSGSAKRNFLMYYSTMTKKTKKKTIACAVSDDGFRWFKRGNCLLPQENTLDDGGCARCNVVQKAAYNEEKGEWKNVDGWLMFYEGISNLDNKHRILFAESDDLRNWRKLGVALDVGDEGSWDEGGVGSPHLIRLDDGTSRIYYTGQGKDGSTAIGVAKSIDDNEMEWTREQAQFSFQ